MKENKTFFRDFSGTILDSVQRKGLTEKLYLSSAKTMLRGKKNVQGSWNIKYKGPKAGPSLECSKEQGK